MAQLESAAHKYSTCLIGEGHCPQGGKEALKISVLRISAPEPVLLTFGTPAKLSSIENANV